MKFDIEICSLKQIDHPNLVELSLTCTRDSLERTDTYLAISAGGGIIEILQCNENKSSIDGSTYVVMIECSSPISFGEIHGCFSGKDLLLGGQQDVDKISDFWLFRTCRKLNSGELALLYQEANITLVREAAPVQLMVSGGRTIFGSGKQVLELCMNTSLPEIAVFFDKHTWFGL